MLDCQNERSPNFLWSEAGLEKRERLIHQQRVIELMSLCCTVFLNKNQCCLFWERCTDCKKMMNFNEWKFNSFLDHLYSLQMSPIFIYCIFGAVNWQKKDQIFKSNENRYIPLFYVALFFSYSKHYVTNFFFQARRQLLQGLLIDCLRLFTFFSKPRLIKFIHQNVQ